jgi:sec-independent protein translocase protein TatA
MPVLFGFFSPGPVELIVIGIVVLLLFGSRLPSVMRNLGRGVVEFKKGINGVDDELENSGNNDTESKA